MRFQVTWTERAVIQRRIIDAPTGDEAVRRVAAQLAHPPERDYEVEPLDDLGYDRRREPAAAF